MTSLQQRIRSFGEGIEARCGKAYHYNRPAREKAPFLVWAEDGEGDTELDADNRKREQTIHGFVDYYTLEEYDPAVDDIQEFLFESGCCWHLNSVLKEEDTNLIHYAWEFSM